MRKLASSRSAPEARSGLRVLIADDDPIFRSVVTAKLERIHAEIIEAADGAAAWRALEAGNFHLALVDLEMPHLKGLELIERMKTSAWTQNIPIVVLTSRNDADAVRSSLDAGATSFMTKPINWSMFANQIDTLLRMHAQAERGRQAEQHIKDREDAVMRAIDRLQDAIEQSDHVFEGAASLLAKQTMLRPLQDDAARAVNLVLQETAVLKARLAAILMDLQSGSAEPAEGSVPAVGEVP